MAWYDYINPAKGAVAAAGPLTAAWSAGEKALGGSKSNDGLLKDQLAGRNPWKNETGRQWFDLLQEQRATALGQRPSLAEMQYRGAMGDAQASLQSAAAGTRRPGVMRASMQQQANLGQGMASGLAQAGLQERMAAQQQYMAGLQGAGQLDQQQNETWLRLMGILQGKPPTPTAWDRLASLAPFASAAI